MAIGRIHTRGAKRMAPWYENVNWCLKTNTRLKWVSLSLSVVSPKFGLGPKLLSSQLLPLKTKTTTTSLVFNTSIDSIIDTSFKPIYPKPSYHSTLSALALGCQIIIFFFKILFKSKIIIIIIIIINVISTINIGSFFDRFLDSEPLT
jgi:hypothetical protein